MNVGVHGFDWPDRFVTGTLGEPGARTFYLQAQEGPRVVSVALEKEQSAALADGVDAVLDQLMLEDGNRFSIPAEAPEGLADHDPLTEPVAQAFRAGDMRLAWDATTAQIVIQVDRLDPDALADRPAGLEDLEGSGGSGIDRSSMDIHADLSDMLVVRIPVGAARAFASRTREIVGQGRAICPICEEPMNAVGHVCPDEVPFSDEFE